MTGVQTCALPISVLKHKRQLSRIIGEEFYESRPEVIIDTYIRGWAKHAAGLKAWGPRGEIKIEAMLKIEAEGLPGERESFERLADLVDGTAEYKYAGRRLRLFNKTLTEFEVGTKIGLGTATLPNVFQLMISTIPKVGLMRTAQAMGEAFTKEEIGRAHV